MSVKITTLVENTVSASLAPLIGEHGLSFLIEKGDSKILFDSGQGIAILGNADALQINLSDVDTVVLSHGHFDHSGGLQKLIERNNNFTLVAHPDVFENKLVSAGGKYTPIGIPTDKEALEKSGIELKLGKMPFEIAPGIMTTGEIAMENNFEKVEPMFFTGETGNEVPDTIPDDKALILDTDKGTVVILGCAHRGPINTLDHVLQLTGNKKIHAVMGGLHLMFADESKLKKIFAYLHDLGVEKMVVGHCTGFKATTALAGEFGDMIIPNVVGHVIEF